MTSSSAGSAAVGIAGNDRNSGAKGHMNETLEAMARGRPVVCTPCEGVSEYARADRNCLQVPPDQPERLAEAVSRLLEDRELASKLGDEARATAKTFTWDRVAERTETAMLSSLSRMS